MKTLSKTLPWLATIALAALAILPAQAKYPEKPITIVVPYGPGGGTDVVARTLGEAIKQVSGATVIIENKAGAGGILAIHDLAKARPDGYSLMIGNVTTSAITPVFFRDKIAINYEQQIAPVARIAMLPSLLVSTAAQGRTNSVAELVAKAKSMPADIRYSSAGVGSYGHFDVELLAQAAGVKLRHIPSASGAAGISQALLNGDAQIAWLNVASALGLVSEKKLVPLAVNTDKRLPQLPDVPTMAELGYPGIGTYNWQALFAPAGMAPETARELQALLEAAMKHEVMQKALERQIMLPALTASPQEARDWIAGEIAHWKTVAGKVSLK